MYQEPPIGLLNQGLFFCTSSKNVSYLLDHYFSVSYLFAELFLSCYLGGRGKSGYEINHSHVPSCKCLKIR